VQLLRNGQIVERSMASGPSITLMPLHLSFILWSSHGDETLLEALVYIIYGISVSKSNIVASFGARAS
jgi:hypothetical protein